MKTKTITAGIAGGIFAFFLGWLVYGIILMPIMSKHGNMSVMRPETEMIWWALILSNILWSFSIALLLDWSNTKGLGAGAAKAAIYGVVLALGWDLSLYSMSNWYTDLSGVLIDVAASVCMSACIGGFIGWIMGKE